MRPGPIDEKEYEEWCKKGGLEIGRENEISTLYHINWTYLKFRRYLTCEHRKTKERIRFDFNLGYKYYEDDIISRTTKGGKELFFVRRPLFEGGHYMTIYNGMPQFLKDTINGDSCL